MKTKQGVPSACPARPSELERVYFARVDVVGRVPAAAPGGAHAERRAGHPPGRRRRRDRPRSRPWARLVFADSVSGLAVDVRVQRLLVHQAAGFAENVMAGSVSYDRLRRRRSVLRRGGGGSRLDTRVGYGPPCRQPLGRDAPRRRPGLGVRVGLPPSDSRSSRRARCGCGSASKPSGASARSTGSSPSPAGLRRTSACSRKPASSSRTLNPSCCRSRTLVTVSHGM